MLIKVLGPGCAKCKEAENIVASAVQEMNSPATVEKITDLKEMMALGVMSTPAVVMDGTIMCTGRVPSKSEVMGWIAAPNASADACGAAAGCCCCGSKR